MLVMLRKSLGGLKAADEVAASVLAGIKENDLVAVEIKRRRNLKMHRLFWALMQKIYENQETYSSPEEVAAAFKVAAGHCDFVQTPRGLVGVPKSISFAKMDQAEFRAFFDKALDYLTTVVIPGLNRDDLEREVMEMTATKVEA